jgi:hypothetical protein
MNNVHPIFAALLADVREATQTLANCAALGKLQKDGTRMPQPGWDVPPDYYDPDDATRPVKIVIERSPWLNAEPQYRWTAYFEGREDELSKAAMTPDEALSRFLIAATNRDEPEID